MNKAQIMQQIKSEMAAEENTYKSARDAAFFAAFAKNRNLKRSDFNKSYKEPARKTLSLKQRYVKRLIEESGFVSNAPKNFNCKYPTPEHEKIYKALSQYCEKFPDVLKRNIVLSGPTGTGKTYAAHIIANNLLGHGFAVYYTTSFGLVEKFQKYIQSFGDSTSTDALFECDLLIIDDLGTEPTIRNITQEHLYNVINERLVGNKPFIITTNLDPSGIFDKYDQRIASRILSKESSVVIEMKSADLRLK